MTGENPDTPPPFTERGASPNEVQRRWPGVDGQTPFDLFDRAALASLDRRLLEAEAAPKDPARFVSNQEVVAVLLQNFRIGRPTARRLAIMAAQEFPRPRGRPIRSMAEKTLDIKALAYYERSLARLTRLQPKARNAWWAKRHGAPPMRTPKQMARELTRQRFYRELETRSVERILKAARDPLYLLDPPLRRLILGAF